MSARFSLTQIKVANIHLLPCMLLLSSPTLMRGKKTCTSLSFSSSFCFVALDLSASCCWFSFLFLLTFLDVLLLVSKQLSLLITCNLIFPFYRQKLCPAETEATFLNSATLLFVLLLSYLYRISCGCRQSFLVYCHRSRHSHLLS